MISSNSRFLPVLFLTGLFSIAHFFTVDRKSSRTKTFSRKVIFMFCVKHLSLRMYNKQIYFSLDDPLKGDEIVRPCDGYINEAVPLRKHVTKYKNK